MFGYEFLGWYDNPEFTGSPVTEIDAAVAADTTLYANWLQVQDRVNLTVTIIHTAINGDGVVENYDKALNVQLTHALKGSNDPHADVEGRNVSIAGAQWHTVDDTADHDVYYKSNIFSGLPSNYTYSLNVKLDGYYLVSRKVTPVTDSTTGVTTYSVEIVLQFDPELLNLNFGVEMAPNTRKELWPVSAEVKVTCWDTHPSSGTGAGWHVISQHNNSTITVTLDPETGKGSGSYPVWQWEEDNVPYYYRITVRALTMSDGTVLNVTAADEEEIAFAQGYSAVITADNACVTPSGSGYAGAYGSGTGGNYSQVGYVKAVISVDHWDDKDDNETDGDGTPDNQQVLVRFHSEPEGMITSGAVQVFTLNNSISIGLAESSVTAVSTVEGYVLSGWKQDNGNTLLTNADVFRTHTVSGGQILEFTAVWTKRADLQYTVNYLNMDDGNKPLKDALTVTNMTYGTTVSSKTEADKYLPVGFVFDHADRDSIILTQTGENENVINLYYTKDVWSDAKDSDAEGDGIPDYQQVLLQYRSAENGSVSGAVMQVHTLKANDKGEYKGMVTPDAVTWEPNFGYRFEKWTNASGGVFTGENANMPVRDQEVVGGNTYTYTVYWEKATFAYTVRYVDQHTGTLLDTNLIQFPDGVEKENPLHGSGVYSSTQTATGYAVTGYNRVGDETQSITLNADNKVVTFHYTRRNDLKLTVYHKEYGTDTEIHPATTVERLTFGDSPDLSVLVESISGFAYRETIPGSIVIGAVDADNVATIYYDRLDVNYTVKYYLDEVVAATYTGSAPFASTVFAYPSPSQQIAGLSQTLDLEEYVLEYVVNCPLTISHDSAVNVIHVFYARDVLRDAEQTVDTTDSDALTGGDGIPDKDQVVVRYHVDNGSWNDGIDADIYKVFSLKKLDAASHTWVDVPEEDRRLGQMPVGTPDPGHNENGTWNKTHTPEELVTKNTDYILTFVLKNYTITTYVENGTVSMDPKSQARTARKIVPHSETETTTLVFIPDIGYALDTIMVNNENTSLDGVTEGVVTYTVSNGLVTCTVKHIQDQHIRVVYSRDENGDSIPDKYQAKINYAITNGTWTGAYEDVGSGEINQYYTLYTSSNGIWSKIKPAPRLQNVPVGTPDEQHSDNPYWSNDVVPTTDTDVTGDAHYHLNYVKAYIIIAGVENGTATSDGQPFTSLDIEHSDTGMTTIEFAPDTGYTIKSITVNGAGVNIKQYQSNGLYSYTADHEQNHIVRVEYALDANNDKIPDEYQATVTYRVINGTWENVPDEENTKDIAQTYSMYQLNEAGTAWVETPVYLKGIPTGSSSTGYHEGTMPWHPFAPAATTQVTGNARYILTFVPNEYILEAEVVNGTATMGTQTGVDIWVEVTHDPDASTTVTFTPNAGTNGDQYVFDRLHIGTSNEAIRDISRIENGHPFPHTEDGFIKVVYELDTVGGAEDPEAPDGIPDIYQKRVIFRVVNGTFGDGDIARLEQYVTLKTKGVYDINGKAAIVFPSNMKPTAGYMNTGSWDVIPVPTEVSGTDTVIYTYTFTEKQKITIDISVVGGTSYPVPSVTSHDYDAQARTTIVFTPDADHILESARINGQSVVLTEMADGKYSYEYGYTQSLDIDVVFVKDIWHDDADPQNDSATGGDGKPDYQQALVRFVADDYGTFQTGSLLTQVFTLSATEGTDSYSGSVNLAAVVPENVEGKRSFRHWTDENGTTYTSDALFGEGKTLAVEGGKEYVFTAHFVYDYRIEYYFNGALDDTKTESGVQNLNTLIHCDKDYSGTEYTLDLDRCQRYPAMTLDHTSGNVMQVHYWTDELKDTSDPTTDRETGGDDVPDYKQALIKFTVRSDCAGMGSVSGAAQQVFTLDPGTIHYSRTVVPTEDKIVVTPESGYKFSHWEYGGVTVNPFQAHNLKGGEKITYEAVFTEESFPYRVEYFFDGVKNPALKPDETAMKVFGTVHSVTLEDRIDTYMLEKVTPGSEITISHVEEMNVIRVYYVTDVWQDNADPARDSETGGDGIPDKYQAVVKFEAADANGTVTGNVLQIVTFPGQAESGTVTPDMTNVKPEAADGFAFDCWTRDNGTIAVNPASALENVPGGTQIVFKAHFAHDYLCEESDGIPDKYQAVVTYAVENGTWKDGTSDPIQVVFTLYEKNADTGIWRRLFVTLKDTVPTGMKSDSHTDEGAWIDGRIPSDSTPVNGNATYVYAFGEIRKYPITVQVINGAADPSDTSVIVPYGEDYRINFQGDSGYALDTVTVDGDNTAVLKVDMENGTTYYAFENVTKEHTIVVEYAVDSICDAERTPDTDDTDSETGGDGIPDKRQAVVEFRAGQNGVIEGKKLYVLTLGAENGVYRGSFTADRKAVSAKADAGYVQTGWTLEATALRRAAADNTVDPYTALAVFGNNKYVYTAIFDKEMETVEYPDAQKDGDPTDPDNPPDGNPDDVTVAVQVTKSVLIKPNGGRWNGSSQDQTIVITEENKTLYQKLADPVRSGYAFTGWKRTDGPENSDIVYVFTAQWAEDIVSEQPGGDGIPDFKQAIVEFRAAEHGAITGKSYWVVTLPLVSGGYQGTFDISRSDMAARAELGYVLQHWLLNAGTTPVDPYQPMAVQGGRSYLFTAYFVVDHKKVTYPDAGSDQNHDQKPDDVDVTVQNGKYIEIRPNGGTWRGSTQDQQIQITSDCRLEDPVRPGYLFMGWERTAGTEDNVVFVFTAQWEKDAVGDQDKDGNEIGDGIPDKYQKKIIFRVVKGFWATDNWLDRIRGKGNNEDIVIFVTLVDENGSWDVNGSAKLTAPTGMYPKSGYEGGKWDKTPPAVVSGTDTEIFTYRFTRKATTGTLPNTGDSIMVFVVVLVVSGTALAAMVILLIHKKRNNKR